MSMTDHAVSRLCDQVMRSVSRCGITADDAEIACKIMREEIKSFLFDDKYDDERKLVLTGNQTLAVQSLTVECVRRIMLERAA